MGCRVIFVGAAGECLGTALYKHVDTILDDFIISLRAAQEGYTIQYDLKRMLETASANVKEEFKRKIRILQEEFNHRKTTFIIKYFKYGTLSFQYISHRFTLEFNFVSYSLNSSFNNISCS
jgi:hypothetical protein